MSKELTSIQLADLAGGDPRTAREIAATGLDVSEIPDMTYCQSLTRLDLSQNKLTSLEPLRHLDHLSWLNVRMNEVTSLETITKLTSLKMLNASNNKLTSMMHVHPLTSLRALILNNNEIQQIQGLKNLTDLNTLVLSHNRIENLQGLEHLKNLAKLSISHNGLRTFPSNAVGTIVELRLNNNKFREVPGCLAGAFSLRILDMGGNRISDLSQVQVLQGLERLSNVNFINNPIYELEDYEKTVRGCVKNLQILDNKKTNEFEQRQQQKKRKEMEHAAAREKSFSKRKRNDKFGEGNKVEADPFLKMRMKHVKGGVENPKKHVRLDADDDNNDDDNSNNNNNSNSKNNNDQPHDSKKKNVKEKSKKSEGEAGKSTIIAATTAATTATPPPAAAAAETRKKEKKKEAPQAKKADNAIANKEAFDAVSKKKEAKTAKQIAEMENRMDPTGGSNHAAGILKVSKKKKKKESDDDGAAGAASKAAQLLRNALEEAQHLGEGGASAWD